MNEKSRDRWSVSMEVVEQVPRNRFRKGEHLDIRIVGPNLSLTLMGLDDFKELVRRARMEQQPESAAAEIARLTAERDRLRAALEKYADQNFKAGQSTP